MKIVYNHIDSVITEDFMQMVADFEGFSSTPYKCPGGIFTIGFGHTAGVTRDTTVTLEIASELLYSDLRSAYLYLSTKIDSFDFDSLPLGLKQALIDFVFNCGIGRFLSSPMFRYLSKWSASSDEERIDIMKKISHAFDLYIFSNGKRLRGLEKRRTWESSLIDDYLLQL